MPTLGQLNDINIFVDLVLTKIGQDYSGTPGVTPSITIAENKIISTSTSFYNITENNYASASSDEKELLIKDGWKIATVEYPYITGDGGTLYHVGDSFDATGEGNGIYIQLEPSGSPKKSVDLTTLPGWEALSSGSHSITIVAKADGYKDSKPSAAVQVEKAAQEYTDCLTFTGENGQNFTLKATYKEWDGVLEYSTDHNTWTTLSAAGVEMPSVNGKLYLRGSGNTKFYTRRGARFVLSARAACSGNIQTLLEYSNPYTGIPASHCYRFMFSGCTSLTQAPALPATTLAEYCYGSMFQNCTSLTQAPALPATTLAKYCYSVMFQNCTSLTQAPVLPATTLADSCYYYMFESCTSLTKAPALPATTLAKYCYSVMFQNCTSLTQAPVLPATTLAEYCYSGMFKGCTSLTVAPALPVTTLAIYCYESMFSGCTSLTVAPALPATTLANYCYYYMFYNCTSLTQVPTLPATTLALHCYSHMFESCTSLTKAPALPATTLADSCYYQMFQNCTSLTQAPALPATTLAEYCYSVMFQNCTSLKISTTQSSEYPTAWRIPSSGTISSTATSWNRSMLESTGGTFTSNPDINTTYYGAWS